MAETVNQHQQSPFTVPVNTPGVGDALDANVVRGNDNSLRAQYNLHDGDAGIHFQSGVLRPAAGIVGRKWLDTATMRVYYDTGAVWTEIGYVVAPVPTDQYFYLFDTRM
jgi:hypothetical protein